MNVALLERCAAVGTILPVGLHALPAIGAWISSGWRCGVVDVLYKPGNAEYHQRDEADRDQPHEEHPNPTEGGISPISHHAVTAHHAAVTAHHAAVTAIASADPRTDPKQDEESDDADEGDCQPVCLFHFVFLL